VKFIIGDKVHYAPVMLSEDTPRDGVVEMVEPAGSIFKMDMLSINTVDHWVPAHECEKISL
jgi:hypothetical protein